MFDPTRISNGAARVRERTIAAWHYAGTQPGWLWRTVASVFFLVLAVPVLLLVLAAIVAASALFAVLWVVNQGIRGLRRLGIGGNEGRRNVRVIRRDPWA